jgi:hypothetical protein
VTRFTYEGLPERNSDFGRKTLTAAFSGECACRWGSLAGYTTAVAQGLFSDPDLDQVPNWVELAEPGCSPVSSHSCTARPFAEVGDAEMNAYWTGWTWALGSANSEDWSCGAFAKQFHGKKCGGQPVP